MRHATRRAAVMVRRGGASVSALAVVASGTADARLAARIEIRDEPTRRPREDDEQCRQRNKRDRGGTAAETAGTHLTTIGSEDRYINLGASGPVSGTPRVHPRGGATAQEEPRDPLGSLTPR